MNKKVDKLTSIIAEYKTSQDTHKKNELILKAQNIITPIATKLICKWHLNSFPKLIHSQVFEDAKTSILLEAIEKFDLQKRKNCKFTSFFATTLNFYLRFFYMKFFQKGKPILKRWGRLHEISLEHEYNNQKESEDSCTLKEILPTDLDLRREIDLNLIKQAIDKLDSSEQKILNKFVSTNKINKKTREVISKLKRLV
jgi:hypothetical protein